MVISQHNQLTNIVFIHFTVYSLFFGLIEVEFYYIHDLINFAFL